MADIAGSSSVPSKDEKPVIVRVKRKAFQSPIEAFWLQINERPLKRPLLDLEKLSISDDSSRKVEELKTKKVFVQHVETINSSEVTIDILQSFVPKYADGYEKSKAKNEERRRSFKTENKQDQLLVKAKQKQEVLSKNARFEQIWRSREGKKEEAMCDHALHEMCRVYDVVRVDVEETKEVHEQEDSDLEDHRIMASYLPLLREFIPSAAVEIESDIHDYMSKQASKDDYLYDLYAVKDINITEEDASNPFPLVQVDEDDEFYAGPIASEDESDDSNAEDNPMNDYPDEETSEDDGDDRSSRPSNDDSEELDSESASNKSSEVEVSDHHNCLEDEDLVYEDRVYCGNGDGDYYDEDEDGDKGDWKWTYR